MSGLLKRRVVIVSFVVIALLLNALPALAATVTRGNPATITIADVGAASPYPSTIDVGGLFGNVTDVNVTIAGLTHGASTDITVLLAGPGGQSIVLMDDNGADSGRTVSNITLTFDDAALNTLPQGGETELTSGTFKPTSVPYGCNANPAPASTPAGPHGAALSVFNGTSPNGVWSLYVYDDCIVEGGSIAGGWSLEITALGPAVTVPADITVANDPGQAGAVVQYSATGSDHGNSPLTPACTPPSGSFFPLGTTSVTCTVTDENGREASDAFTITVNDAETPVLSLPGNIEVTASGAGGTIVNYSASATDNSGSASISCLPPSGSLFANGTTTVNCTAIDASNNSTSGSFTVTVNTPTENPSVLLAQLRADTITLVTNSSTERSMVAVLDIAQYALDQGNTWQARLALVQYELQIQRALSTRRRAPC